jgi:hypothetical protein
MLIFAWFTCSSPSFMSVLTAAIFVVLKTADVERGGEDEGDGICSTYL